MFMSVLRSGRALVRLIVHTPPVQPPSLKGIANVIVFVSGSVFAAAIASRKLQSASHVPSLVSAVLVTTKFGPGTDDGSASVQSLNDDTPFLVAKCWVVFSTSGVNWVKPPSYLKIL